MFDGQLVFSQLMNLLPRREFNACVDKYRGSSILRINAFYGTSDNAVKTQVWIAISVYVLVAIVKKELRIERSLSDIVQILSLTLFEKTPLFEALNTQNQPIPEPTDPNQLKLFDL